MKLNVLMTWNTIKTAANGKYMKNNHKILYMKHL